MELICKYTRCEAIDDGVLMDVPVNILAHEMGIKWHCALTASLHVTLNRVAEDGRNASDMNGIVSDMLFSFLLSLKMRSGKLVSGDRWPVKFLLSKTPLTVNVVFSVEEMHGEVQPCWTFMLPTED